MKVPLNTYSYKCDVKAFVNSLAAKESFKARMLRDVKKVIDILADPDCEVIRGERREMLVCLGKTVLEEHNSSRENGPCDSQGFLTL